LEVLIPFGSVTKFFTSSQEVKKEDIEKYKTSLTLKESQIFLKCN
jgi:hypothetical protein